MTKWRPITDSTPRDRPILVYAPHATGSASLSVSASGTPMPGIDRTITIKVLDNS